MTEQIEIKRTPKEIADAVLAIKHEIKEQRLEADGKNVNWRRSAFALLDSPIINSFYSNGAKTMLAMAELEGRMQVFNFLFGDDNEISRAIKEDWKRIQEGLNP